MIFSTPFGDEASENPAQDQRGATITTVASRASATDHVKHLRGIRSFQM
ncbi:MAG TPA: hypothetical protein PLL90_03160 [Bacteroidales bacterium]|nr:hypothetical protein [Bacteroidales bacterium]